MNDRSSAAKLVASLGLVLVVCAIYGRTGNHPFIDFDDSEYVYENEMVRQGLSRDGIVWAFSTFWSANWHPITWLSHMADVQMFGLDAGWHHLTNVVLHSLNAVLLLFVLTRMTHSLWRSTLVAALFAVHPQHVESVAWIAERKDVLSTCFWLLTMGAYINFVRCRGAGPYVLVLLTYSFGLMSKPMLVTLPLVLLLLDYWPLQRLGSAPRMFSEPDIRPRILELIREKLPLALLALTSSVITYAAQSRWEATASLNAIPLDQRVANAFVSTVVYVAKTLFPVSLAIFYPHPFSIGESVPVLALIASAGALAVLTVMAIRQWRERPWITVGWLWFLITLAPVIGLVQIGSQAMADRYTYVPHIGLFILLVWSVPAAVERSRPGKVFVAALCGCLLFGLSAMTWAQVGYWRDGVTLYAHAIGVTQKNWLAWNNLGMQYLNAARLQSALDCFGEAVRIKSNYADGWYNLGVAQARLGLSRQAIESYEASLRLDPRNADGWTNLGIARQNIGDYGPAIVAYQSALQIRPDDSLALQNLVLVYASQGDLAKVFSTLERLRVVDRQKWSEITSRFR
jgi:hypothetical protein